MKHAGLAILITLLCLIGSATAFPRDFLRNEGERWGKGVVLKNWRRSDTAEPDQAWFV